jgi:hypothetical protein
VDIDGADKRYKLEIELLRREREQERTVVENLLQIG